MCLDTIGPNQACILVIFYSCMIYHLCSIMLFVVTCMCKLCIHRFPYFPVIIPVHTSCASSRWSSPQKSRIVTAVRIFSTGESPVSPSLMLLFDMFDARQSATFVVNKFWQEFPCRQIWRFGGTEGQRAKLNVEMK